MNRKWLSGFLGLVLVLQCECCFEIIICCLMVWRKTFQSKGKGYGASKLCCALLLLSPRAFLRLFLPKGTGVFSVQEDAKAVGVCLFSAQVGFSGLIFIQRGLCTDCRGVERWGETLSCGSLLCEVLSYRSPWEEAAHLTGCPLLSPQGPQLFPTSQGPGLRE